MAKMKVLQPQLAALKAQYGEDKQSFTKAMMKLYKQEKANPFGGCLPLLVQAPIFMALYWVLMESVQLRQAGFIFWIQDLSLRDPYYVLPVINGIIMFVQQKMQPPPPDPTQAKVMMFLPVIFTVMFLGLPSGLVLYWIVQNLINVCHQRWVLKKYERKHKLARS